MQQPLEIAVLGAGDRGFHAYGAVARKHSDRIRFIAVAEPNPKRRLKFAKTFKLSAAYCFGDWQELLNHKQLAAKPNIAILNTLQDTLHLQPTMQALTAGRHVLLEKPMAVTARDCMTLVETAETKKRVLQICHVLRYSKMFKLIKEILDSGAIGDLICIQHNENIGFWHMAHSYVRGNWRCAEESSPLILAKSCHDTDLLTWYAGSKAKAVSSFGSLAHFRRESAPPGAPERCTENCPHEKVCPYSAPRFYLRGGVGIPLSLLTGVSLQTVWEVIKNPKALSFATKITEDLSRAGILQALKESPYGRCVYRCDNDVCDHQVTIIEFENGVKASLTLSAFTPLWERTIKLMGTKGEIRAADFRGRLEIRTFHPLKVRKFRVGFDALTHGSGDEKIFLDFLNSVNAYTDGRKQIGEILTSARNSLESHLIAFAAEEARRFGQTIVMKDYRRQIKS